MMSEPDRVASFLLKPVARARMECNLLADGDRVAVAVSGGKDSRALLELQLRYQRKLALGHNADDAAATMLMNVMFNGRLETMAPKVEFFDRAVTVIRPLIYVPEKVLVRCGRVAGFPKPPECPQATTSTHAQVTGSLRQLGRHQGQIRANLWGTARRAMGF